MKRLFCIILVWVMVISLTGCNGGGGGGDSSDSGGGSAALDLSDVTLLFNFDDIIAMHDSDKEVMLARLVDFISQARDQNPRIVRYLAATWAQFCRDSIKSIA